MSDEEKLLSCRIKQKYAGFIVKLLTFGGFICAALILIGYGLLSIVANEWAWIISLGMAATIDGNSPMQVAGACTMVVLFDLFALYTGMLLIEHDPRKSVVSLGLFISLFASISIVIKVVGITAIFGWIAGVVGFIPSMLFGVYGLIYVICEYEKRLSTMGQPFTHSFGPPRE